MRVRVEGLGREDESDRECGKDTTISFPHLPSLFPTPPPFPHPFPLPSLPLPTLSPTGPASPHCRTHLRVDEALVQMDQVLCKGRAGWKGAGTQL